MTSRTWGGVDERIPMHDAVPEKLGVLQAGNHAENAFLLAKCKVGLKSDEIVCRACSVFRPELHGCPRPSTRTGIGQPHGLHGSVPDRVVAGTGNFLGGLACLEKIASLKILEHHALRPYQLVDERIVFILGEWGVQVIPVRLIIVAGLREHDGPVDRAGVDDRRRCIEKRKGITTD